MAFTRPPLRRRGCMPTPVEDKAAIREVLAEYCSRLDDSRFDEMATLFTEDGTWDTAFGKATGRAAIADLARDNSGASGRAAASRDPPGDQHRDRAGRRERAGALELGGCAEQPGWSKNRFGRRLSRRARERARAVAVPLSQDRPLHRPLTILGDGAARVETLNMPALGAGGRVDDG